MTITGIGGGGVEGGGTGIKRIVADTSEAYGTGEDWTGGWLPGAGWVGACTAG